MKNQRRSTPEKNQRISTIINFFAFNLLFFALYLNFIHQDANTASNQSSQRMYKQATILADNQEQYLNKATAKTTPEQTMAVNSTASKRSLN